MMNRTESDDIIDRINKEFRDERIQAEKTKFEAIDRIRAYQKQLIHEQRIESEKIEIAELKLKKEEETKKQIEELDSWKPLE